MRLASMLYPTSKTMLSPSIYREKRKEKRARILAGWPDKCFGQGRSTASRKGLAMSLTATTPAAQPAADDDHLVRKELVKARLGNVSESTLYRMVRSGRFPD